MRIILAKMEEKCPFCGGEREKCYFCDDIAVWERRYQRKGIDLTLFYCDACLELANLFIFYIHKEVVLEERDQKAIKLLDEAILKLKKEQNEEIRNCFNSLNFKMLKNGN